MNESQGLKLYFRLDTSVTKVCRMHGDSAVVTAKNILGLKYRHI